MRYQCVAKSFGLKVGEIYLPTTPYGNEFNLFIGGYYYPLKSFRRYGVTAGRRISIIRSRT